MRILYIDVNCKNSSTGNIVYYLHNRCIDNNIQSAVCYGRGKKIKEKNIYKFGIDLETYNHAVLTRLTGYTGSFSFISTMRLINYIKKFKPDLIHIHELHAYFVNIKTLLSFLKNKNIPTIFTNHCEFLYTGKCGHSGNCLKYSQNCGHCPFLHEYPKSMFFDHTASMLRTKKQIFNGWDKISIVSPSRWMNNRLDISFLKDAKRFVVYNSIDTKIFHYDNNNTKSSNNIISVAPNIFSKNKGGYRILEIAKLLPNYHFVIVGDTQKTKINLKNVTTFPLINDKSYLAKLYSNSDCLLIMSKHESFSLISVEAQCCGTKVLAYDVGGIKETIIPGGGEVVSFSDKKTLIKKIIEICHNKYNKIELSKRARKIYKFDNMFNSYLNIYKDILKK